MLRARIGLHPEQPDHTGGETSGRSDIETIELAHQRALILALAEQDGVPAGRALRQVAYFENVIDGVEAAAAVETDRTKRP